MGRQKEKFLFFPCWEANPDRPARSLVTILTELSLCTVSSIFVSFRYDHCGRVGIKVVIITTTTTTTTTTASLHYTQVATSGIENYCAKLKEVFAAPDPLKKKTCYY
jgi:hypothetical protein